MYSKNNEFKHGGDIFAAAEDLNGSWDEILDFSANINPFGPPPRLKKHLFKNFSLTEHYPDPYALKWRKKLAAAHNLDQAEVLAGNGTTALLYLFARTMAPNNPVIAGPGFLEYEMSLLNTGISPEYVLCSPDEDFDLTENEVEKIFEKKPDVIYLANPTSPAGRLVDEDLLDQVIEEAQRINALVVLDEAFLDFTDIASRAGAVIKHRNLVVMRSMTKFYALPGLRLGYMTASADLIDKITPGAEPWAVNSLALAAGEYCLDQPEYAVKTKKMVSRERERLRKKLINLGLGHAVKSEANYILVKINAPGLTEEYLLEEMKARGILIRGCSTFQNLNGYIRVAVKNRRANNALIDALEDIMS